MNRRKFLTIAGSAAIIVAAGTTGCTPTQALKPWKQVGSRYNDPMRHALSFAILAPNPHNRQPWVVDLKSDTEAVLTCDLERLIPATDPFGRQIVIGLGCFLELFSIAAAEQGYKANIRYFPEGEISDRLDSRPIAHLKLEKQSGLPQDPLFQHVLKRHTNRNPYNTARPIADNIAKQFSNAAMGPVWTGVANSGKMVTDLRVLTRDAMIAEVKTPKAYQESIDLMRIGRTEIEANPDGISLGGAFLETLSLTGILTRENLADPTSSAYQTGIDMVVDGAMSAMGFVWIVTPNNDRTAQIESGREYMRVALQVVS